MQQSQPTLLILVAPFSVGFSSYVAPVGRIDQSTGQASREHTTKIV
jgi:hypothetical protein